MYRFIQYIFFACSALILTGCSETEIIVPNAEDIISDRVVLVEDFTGVKCVNCPTASREIKSLIDRYPENMVAVAYHTDFLGSPITVPADARSKYDFRTADGQKLEDQMGSYLGKPAVSLDRKIYNPMETFLLTGTTVLGNIVSELQSIPKVLISIDNLYDAASRTLTATVTVSPQANVTGDFRLHALITESHIIDSQEDNTEIVKDYEHNHVFRTMLSALEGDVIGANLITGAPVIKKYTFTLPPEAGWWVAENCTVVVFVTDLNKKTYQVGEVLQAGEKHLTE